MKQQTFTISKAFLLLILNVAPQSGWAQRSSGATGGNQFYFEETFFPVYVSKNDAVSDAGGGNNQAVPTESGLGFDTRTTFGGIWNNLLYGLTFNYFSVNSSRPRTADFEGLDFTTKKLEWGPTIGYFLGSWRFTLTYFLSATKEVTQKYTDQLTGIVTTDETYSNKDGKGFQIGFGYDFALGAGFGISPTLVYRSVSYGKQSYSVRTGAGTPYGSTSLQTKAIDNELKPMITVTYRF